MSASLDAIPWCYMSYIKKRVQLLTRPSVAVYMLSALFATFASGASYVAMSWWILHVDDSVSATALLMFCFWVPVVIFGPFLGVMADRHSRKWLMICGNGGRGLILILFAYFFQQTWSSTSLYFLMVILGMTFSIYWPAATTLIREIVAPNDLLHANATLDMAYEFGNVAGMGSAGFLISQFSVSQTLLIIAILFIISALLLMQVRVGLSTVKQNSLGYCAAVAQDFILGLRYLQMRPQLIVVYSIQLCILVSFMITPIFLAPFAKEILKTNVSQFGHIEASLSIGVIIGGFFIPWVAERLGFFWTLTVAGCALAILLGAFGINRSILGADILYFLIGTGLSIWPVIVTRAQALTEFSFQGRVQSLFQSLSGAIVLLVYLLVSLTGHWIPVSYFYGLEVLIILCGVGLLWRYRVLIGF